MNRKNRPSILIAFGGNALNVAETDHPHQKEEFVVARKSLETLVPLLQNGYEKIILTHGNGPQVGQIFLQQELTRNEFPRQVTLDVCVADSQGRIGFILQNVFDNVCSRHGIQKRSFSIITQVLVDPKDPAFHNPTKPIGVFYSKEDADHLVVERGWTMVEDAGRGFRRVIPSPLPLEIVEKDIFQEILNLGFIGIGGGGGGIPVIRNSKGELEGIEAVIDKDRTSALLANTIGIEVFVILTQVSEVYLNFNTPGQTPINHATSGEMQQYLEEGHFAEGSMKPKIEACLRFLKHGGKKTIIANLYDLARAMEGKSGTHIVPG